MCTKNLLVPLLWERTWTLQPSGYGLKVWQVPVRQYRGILQTHRGPPRCDKYLLDSVKGSSKHTVTLQGVTSTCSTVSRDPPDTMRSSKVWHVPARQCQGILQTHRGPPRCDKYLLNSIEGSSKHTEVVEGADGVVDANVMTVTVHTCCLSTSLPLDVCLVGRSNTHNYHLISLLALLTIWHT